jgi:hypothetical protein
MNTNEKLAMGFGDYQEHNRGLRGILEAILYVMLGLLVIGCVYSFFLKTELSKIATPIKSEEVEKTHLY